MALSFECSRGGAKLAEEAATVGAVRPRLNAAAVVVSELGPVKVPDRIAGRA